MVHFRAFYFSFNLINFLMVVSCMSSKSQSEQCPTMCLCDIYMEYNRANCSNERLVTANIGMSSYVEVLDLSNNDITVLDNTCFVELKYLTILLLRNNDIENMYEDAFIPITNLQTIDLANNRLATFDKNIFEQNSKLTSVTLSGNKFMNLNNVPILKSQSIQTLEMKNTKLTHLHLRLFEELPNLKTLDISDNLLITVNLVPFAQNIKLRSLNIEGNPLTCDPQLELTLIWFKRNRIRVKSKKCPQPVNRTTTTVRMFERMEMMPTKPAIRNVTVKNHYATEAPVPKDLSKIWKINENVKIVNQICPLNDTDRACDLFEACITNLTALMKEVATNFLQKKSEDYEISPHQNWLHFVTVNIAFYAGLILGIFFGGCFIYLITVIVSKCFKGKKISEEELRRAHMRNRMQRNHATHVASVRPTERSNRPTPSRMSSMVSNVPSQSSRAAAPNRDQELIRYDDDHRRHRYPPNSIFSLLFERPARHRYYRQLNRSATNLVRRLSQSRLFLNSSRSQNAQYRNSYVGNRNNSSRTEELETDNTNIVDAITAHQDNLLNDRSHAHSIATLSRSASMPSVNVEDATELRSNHADEDYEAVYSSEPEINVRDGGETPPPAYLEIVRNAEK